MIFNCCTCSLSSCIVSIHSLTFHLTSPTIMLLILVSFHCFSCSLLHLTHLGKTSNISIYPSITVINIIIFHSIEIFVTAYFLCDNVFISQILCCYEDIALFDCYYIKLFNHYTKTCHQI